MQRSDIRQRGFGPGTHFFRHNILGSKCYYTRWYYRRRCRDGFAYESSCTDSDGSDAGPARDGLTAKANYYPWILTDEVQSLFEATAAEANKEAEFEEMYEVVVIPIQSQADASNVSHMLPDSR